MKTSNISRQQKKDAHATECEVQHQVWVMRIQELMRDTGRDAMGALKELEKEVDKQRDEVWPVERAQFDECWRNFMKRVEAAKLK